MWYVDATFKVVREPFYQLFSIHAFVRSGSDTKQIPLLFALMSRRRTKDYVAVIELVMEKLGVPNVQRFVADFEIAVWKAFKKALPASAYEGLFFSFHSGHFQTNKRITLTKVVQGQRCATFRNEAAHVLVLLARQRH